MKDSLATTGPGTVALERPTPTARRLVEASISPNTWADVAYAGDGDGDGILINSLVLEP